MAELYVCGQLEIGSGFKSNRLSCVWSLEIGGGWRVIEGHANGQSQTDIPSLFESAFFSHPIDLHLATKTIQGWPKLNLQVWHYDEYNRQELYGYGSIFVPSAPGAHTLTCPIWRPKGSTRDELMQNFVGGGLQLTSLDILSDPADRPKISCLSMGEVQITLYVISRHFDRFGILT
ncbi:unnamed protein product [Auanema sp. JU1783]|nr:unnamed protein product [Auanema sp. JU1783]